jgi:hypothetical protein
LDPFLFRNYCFIDILEARVREKVEKRERVERLE